MTLSSRWSASSSCGTRNLAEQQSLLQVRRRVDSHERKPDGPSIVVRGRRVVDGQGVPKDVRCDGVPVAQVSVRAHRDALVLLPFVVQRHDRRIGGEGAPVAVTNDNRCSRKNEAMVADGPGIHECRMTDGTTERAHLNAVGRANEAVDLRLGATHGRTVAAASRIGPRCSAGTDHASGNRATW